MNSEWGVLFHIRLKNHVLQFERKTMICGKKILLHITFYLSKTVEHIKIAFSGRHIKIKISETMIGFIQYKK